MHRIPGRQRMFRIVDRDLLAHELQRAVDRKYGGSQKRAAGAVGISQPHLNRLIRGRIASVTFRTIEVLRRLVPTGRRGRLERAILAPAAQQALRFHDAWMRRKSEQLAGLDEARAARTDDETERRVQHAMERDREAKALRRYLRKRFPELFDDFDDFLKRHGHFKSRALLAYTQIVYQLLEHDPSGGIERDWTDIEVGGGLRKYLKGAFACQKILLARSPDVQRAQQVAENSPDELLSTLVDKRTKLGLSILG